MFDQSDLNRRDFMRLSGLATAGVVVAACGTPPPSGEEAAAPAAEGAAEEAPAPEAEGSAGDVAREKTLILMFGGDGSQFTDVSLGNPYATGASHQMGSAALWEPLFFYSAFAGEEIPWLATSYEYNDDYTELTLTMREGVKWSDGETFDANDVAFTLNMLRDNAPVLNFSTAVNSAVAEATAVDDLTVHITFNEPRPRFMFGHLMSKFDTGLKWVPEHIFKDVEDVGAFEFYDPEKGWPLTTGPYEITQWSPQQKFIDRRDDWWGVETGFAEKLPEIERILVIPRADDTLMTQRIVNDEVDSTLGLRATTITPTLQNPAVITHTGTEPPYGYMDWWPTSLWFNHEEGPYTEKDVRWAVSYAIDRQQLLDVALQGSGIITELPFPQYPAMQPYFDAAEELLAKYPTNEFNQDKVVELMEGQGYEKDGEGFWVKDGERIPAIISGWQVFNDIGPIIAEQLRRAGFEAEWTTPADNGSRISDGTQKIWLNGHAASIADPFATLDLYTSKYWAPIGEPTSRGQSRFRNAEYDEILAQMAVTPSDDPGYMDLYLAAMEIWLGELVEAPIQQWMHRIPMNTTYWEDWPTEENPYINGAFWHTTFPLMLHEMTPAQ